MELFFYTVLVIFLIYLTYVDFKEKRIYNKDLFWLLLITSCSAIFSGMEFKLIALALGLPVLSLFVLTILPIDWDDVKYIGAGDIKLLILLFPFVFLYSSLYTYALFFIMTGVISFLQLRGYLHKEVPLAIIITISFIIGYLL